MSVQVKEVTLGEKIRFYRKRVKISQLELSIRSNIGVSSIAKIEQDQRKPSLETIHRIGAALKLDPKEFAYLLDLNLYAEEYAEEF